MSSKKICITGVLIALSMVFSYVDSLITIIPSAYFVKLGLANICVMFCLYVMSERYAFFVLLIRVVLMGITFTSFSAMIYSLSGGLLSFFVMYILKKTGLFSIIAVSVAGAICHNMGQLIVAFAVLESKAVLTFIPTLIISGMITGFLIGIISKIIIKRIKIFKELL